MDDTRRRKGCGEGDVFKAFHLRFTFPVPKVGDGEVARSSYRSNGSLEALPRGMKISQVGERVTSQNCHAKSNKKRSWLPLIFVLADSSKTSPRKERTSHGLRWLLSTPNKTSNEEQSPNFRALQDDEQRRNEPRLFEYSGDADDVPVHTNKIATLLMVPRRQAPTEVASVETICTTTCRGHFRFHQCDESRRTLRG